MFKTYVVDTAFDVVAAISEGLKKFFNGNGSDYAAGWVMAVCLIVIVLAIEHLAGKLTRARLAWMACLLLAGFGAAVAFVCLSHTSICIQTEKARHNGGKAFRVRLEAETLAKMAGKRWWVVETPRRFAAFPALRDRPFESQTHGVLPVDRDGGGRFFLKDQLLYFSSERDGADASRASHWIVIEHPQLAGKAALAGEMTRAAVVAFFAARLLWLLAAPLRLLARSRGFLITAGLFVIYYGSHQWRFISQDSRMQMVTSREDDAYMMERLERCVKLQSMDPVATDNNAYGAIAYYPYALLPAAAGKLGFDLPLEALNAYVRGLKLLGSLAFLAAIWLLAERHFGKMEAVVATLCTASWYGFLKYSSYPFYPDVLTAAFSVLSLHHMLELLDGWDGKALALATVNAAMAVSIKFISFLLFPILLLAVMLSALRKFPGQAGAMARFLVIRAAVLIPASIAVFFLCNPFLDYNLNWIVPNMKMVHNLYSTATPNVVAVSSASFADWVHSTWAVNGDYVAAVAIILTLSAAAAILAGLAIRSQQILQLASSSASRGAQIQKAGVLLLYGAGHCWYLHQSIKLTMAIDERLVLTVYPLALVAGTLAVKLAWPLLGLRFGPGLKLHARTHSQAEQSST